MLVFNDDSNWLKSRISGVEKAYIIPNQFNNLFTGIAVDIGANVGAFPIVNHNRFGRIICVEPSEYSFNECKKNTSKFTNVEVHKFAVSNKSNEIIKLKSYKEANFSGNASTLDSELWNNNDFELVKTISIEDIFNKFNIIKIDYLKIDCEGGEYDFLMNKNLLNVDYLSIEIHIQLNEKAIELEEYINSYYILTNQIGDGITSHKELTFKNKLL